MKKTIFKRILGILAMSTLAILLFSCPDELQVQEQENKATVSFSVTDSTVRTVLPQVSLADVASYKLLGQLNGAAETELAEFTTGGTTVSLNPGTWNFTLDAYDSIGGHILQGKIQNRQINTGTNQVAFSLSVMNGGTGAVQITFDFPTSAGITQIVAKSDTDSESFTPANSGNFVYTQNGIPAGDYFINFELYREDVLQIVVSELVVVRNSLTSSKTITLTGDDLKPLLTGTVSIIGTPSVGQTLTADAYTVNGIGNISYQWKLTLTNDETTDIGTNSNTYTVQEADAGGTITVIVTREGYVGSVTSIPTSAVPALSMITFANLTANGSATALTTRLTLAFDSDINGLSSTDITLTPGSTGTTRGTLSRTGAGVYELTVSGITASGTVTVEVSKAGYTISPASRTVNVIFYAATYTITYRDVGSGTFSGTHGSNAPTTHTYGTATTLVSPTKTGYSFGGWFINSDGTGTALTSLATTAYTANITLHAKWMPIPYSITYRDVGNTTFSGTHGSGYPTTHTYGTATTLVNPTRTAYRFDGWFDNSGGTGTALTSLAATTYTANITLYAKWTPVSYSITYRDVGGGTFSGTHGSGYPTTHTYGTATTLVSPTKTGYSFGGWFINSDGTGTALTSLAATTYTANITLHAKWTTTQIGTPLPFSTTVSGSITATISSNRYQIYLVEAGTVTVSLTTSGTSTALPNLGADVQWLNTSGTRMGGTTTGFSFPYSVDIQLSAGTYYIEINGRSGVGYTGIYSIRADYYVSENEPNNTLATARTLIPGQTVRGSITSSDNTDYFKYVLTQPGRLSVTVYRDSTGGLADMYITWYTADGTQIRNTELYNGTYNQYVDFEVGTYYIRITPYSSSDTGTYNLRGEFAAAENNETEPNNERGTAQSLIFGQTVKGFISYQDKTDMYRYVLTRPGRFTVNVTRDSTGQLTDMYVRWYNVDGAQIRSTNYYNGSYSEYMDLEAGTYYISITPYDSSNNGNTGTYYLSASFTDGGTNEIEPNSTRPEAQLLESGQTVKGFISYQDKIDMYRFVLTQSRRLTVNITRDNTGGLADMYVKWYDADGTELRSTNYYNGSYSQYMDLPAGTYYISITPYDSSSNGNTGTYNLTGTITAP